MEERANEKIISQNYKLIDLLRFYKDLDKVDIAKLLGVSMPTLYKSIEDLKKVGMIDQNNMSVSKNRITLIGISIGSAQTKIVFLHADFSLFTYEEFKPYKNQIIDVLKAANIQFDNSNVLDENYIYVSTPKCFDALKDILDIIFDQLLKFNEVNDLSVVSIGISCTGVVNSNTLTIHESHNLPCLRGNTVQNLIFPAKRNEFERHKISISLLQNSNAAVIAEKIRLYQINSVYKSRNNIAAIYVGVGTGAGLILNGTFFAGTSGFAGEIGHIIAPQLPDHLEQKSQKIMMNNQDLDSRCTCGNTNCYDFVIRTKALAKNKEEISMMKSGDIYKLLKEDTDKQEILGFYLGHMVNMLTSLLNVDLVVFTGKIAKSMPLLSNYITKIQDKNQLKFSRNDCEVITSDYGALSPAIGAAVYSYYNKFDIPCTWSF